VGPIGPSVVVAAATITVKCSDGTTYTVGTGNANGDCMAKKGNYAYCADNKGNGSIASCEDGCKSSSGSGSCTVK
jgi:hypothetical protein